MNARFLIALVCLATTALGAASSTRPNILLVMADDQGWGDTGYNGHPHLKTPELDKLAGSGLRFDRFYAAHCNCSPTRGSVLTGRHPNRYGTFSPGSPIRAQELTVARVLQSAGYATGHFGKWHLNGRNGDRNTTEGDGRAILADDPLSPGRMGFDEWVSADNFFDLNPVLGRNGVPEKFHGDGSDITTDEALKFIRRQAAAGKPFLSVVWFGSPHVPHEALPDDKAPYRSFPEKERNYYGEIAAIDRSVGRLRAALRELAIADNTLLWYCSDNGGHAGPNSTGHLRGEKGTLWEGGLRVPGIVEWPARIPRPFVSAAPSSTLDIYPTILAATGVIAQSQILPLDGTNLLPLFDRQTETRAKPMPFWNRAGRQPGHAVWLDWPYKLHTDALEGRDRSGKKGLAAHPVPLLFDVAKDPKETTDLAPQQPERVARMLAALEAWKASVEKSLSGADYVGGTAQAGSRTPAPVEPRKKKKKKEVQ